MDQGVGCPECDAIASFKFKSKQSCAVKWKYSGDNYHFSLHKYYMMNFNTEISC